MTKASSHVKTKKADDNYLGSRANNEAIDFDVVEDQFGEKRKQYPVPKVQKPSVIKKSSNQEEQMLKNAFIVSVE